MQNIMGLGATSAAALGILICLLSGVARIAGNFHIAGFQSFTLFTGGMALMLLAALLKLEAIHSLLKKANV